METGITARPLRHRQTKGAETDTPGLTFTAPHSYSTVKPLRRECRIASAALYARARTISTIAHGIAGAARIRHSLRPLVSRGRENYLQTSGASCRENAEPHPRRCQRIEYKTHPRHCEERLRRSNPWRRKRRDGLLRGACHRARIRATRWLAMTWIGRSVLAAFVRAVGLSQ